MECLKKLIEDYQEGKITRRQFIRRAVVLTGNLVVAVNLMDSFIPSISYAAMVDPSDPALVSGMVKYTGKAGTVFAYQSRPGNTC